MKADELESLHLPSRGHSSRFESPVSSKFKLSGTGKTRKIAGKNLTSVILQNRQNYRIIEDDVDVTPKLLTHPIYSSIDEKQITAFETIGLSQIASIGQLSIISGIRSTSAIIRTSSLPSGTVVAEDMLFESLLSTQIDEYIYEKEEAPPQFYLSSDDPNIFLTRPETVKLCLKETETFFIFELIPRVADLNTPEGIKVQKENENYEYKTIGPGSHRKLVEIETQTIEMLMRSRGTYLSRKIRVNEGMFVNNWVIYDTYAQPELILEKNGLFVVHRKESIQKMLEAQNLRSKLPKSEIIEMPTLLEEQIYIFQRDNFRNAVRIIERIISHNIFIDAQKRFTGLIKQDPCSLDLEFTYNLNLLWTYSSEQTLGRPIAALRWNYINRNILAVGYGARDNSEIKNGLVFLWSAKNPANPARRYAFNSQVSDLDWSRDRPNLLAVGFYNGEILVIDVSKPDINIIRRSQKSIDSPSHSPHWQVQWWPGDEQYEFEEQIYTCNQDGCIFCYPYVEDFTSIMIMKVFRIEGTLPGVTRTVQCDFFGVSISRSPGALVLQKHPTLSTIYFIGSDEGCIYKCSTNYLYQYIDNFLAHDGPVYSMMFSPFCEKIFLTCGADWCIRIWAEGLTDPLITLSTTMACVRYAAWSPIHSTIIASIVNNEICIWDIRRKIYKPASVTISPSSARFVMINFTANGNQLALADIEGVVYLYNLEGMPFPPYNQQRVLIDSIKRALITKPIILKNLKKLGSPFS